MKTITIQKKFQISIHKILSLLKPSEYLLKLQGHHLNNKVIELTKVENEYKYSVISPIIKGVQKHLEIQFDREDKIELISEDLTLYTAGKNFILQTWEYLHDEATNNSYKQSYGLLTGYSTTSDNREFNDKHLRLVIPIYSDKKPFDIHQFQTRWYKSSKSNMSSGMIVCNISDEIFHICFHKLGDSYYLIIDSTSPQNLALFQKKCFNILLTIGVVTGNLVNDESFILSFEQEEKDIPLNILYFPSSSSVITKQPSFTSTPMSIYYFDTSLETDEKGTFTEKARKKLYDGIILFPENVFSNISTLFYKYEKLQRAALIFLQSHIASLEVRIPNYYVAIEAITGYISKQHSLGDKNLAPIKDKKIADLLIQKVQEFAQNLKQENKLNDLDFDISILEKNINKLNAPPNADKLAKSFNIIGYTLSKEELSLLKKRNKFLHGSFIKTFDDDKAFREALHLSLRVRYLLTVLILKLGGFSGKIINYAELWSHITEMNLNEEKLIKI